MNITGFNHITIAVRDLAQSTDFYCEVLGGQLIHRGNADAYIELGSAWLCLLERPDRSTQAESTGVDHVAFSIPEAEFAAACVKLQTNGIQIVRGPVIRGTGWSVNFLDPDGTQLELHTSNLQQRLTVWR